MKAAPKDPHEGAEGIPKESLKYPERTPVVWDRGRTHDGPVKDPPKGPHEGILLKDPLKPPPPLLPQEVGGCVKQG